MIERTLIWSTELSSITSQRASSIKVLRGSNTFSVPGIYTYKCTPHVAAGMVGVVVVGNDLSNMEQAMDNKQYYGQSKELIQKILKSL